jgi:DNA-binding transcriptional LysR family regulator
MPADLSDLASFVAVAKSGGFREAARSTRATASTLSEALRRLEAQLGVRLLHRTTRSVAPTEAGARLLERLEPALAEVDAALDLVNGFRATPSGTLRLNVPVTVARLILPPIATAFLRAYPDVKLEIIAQDRLVDVLAEGCDAGIRYDERLEKDMIAVPIGPRVQRYAAAAAPAYLAAHPRIRHPRDLLAHACIRQRFSTGTLTPWEFEHKGKLVRVDPSGPLVVTAAVVDLAISAAIAGAGVVFTFESWLAPALERGELAPVLKAWWHAFSGPYLYYPGRSYVPAPLRAFIDFVRAREGVEARPAAQTRSSRAR